MTSQEEGRIKEWHDELFDDIKISLIITEDERTTELKDFCSDLSLLAPKLNIVNERGDLNELPCIKVGDSIRYHGVPLGTELEPFLLTLSGHLKSDISVSTNSRERLKKLNMPVELELYVSQQCPVCPSVIRQVTPLSFLFERIRIAIIDCVLFPEKAQSNRIQSVPTVIFDKQFRWTGPMELDELIETIINPDPAALSVSYLERMLEGGDALEVAQMMLDKEMIFPQFLELLVIDKWSVRMGAAVAMEEISEHNQRLAARIIEPLWEQFDDLEDPIKDDLLYIFGKIRNDEAEARLKDVLDGQYNPEVKEAAREALEACEAGGET